MTRRQKHYLGQICIGITLIIIGVLSTVILEGDITACVLFTIIAVQRIAESVFALYYYYIVKRRRKMGEF